MKGTICCEEKCTACMACANACPKNAMDGNNNSFPKHLRQPCKERRPFGVDVHHIVFSKCTIKCRKCGGADCSKSP